MGIGIGLSGSSVERADLYYNDNGIIRNIDHYDVWINESGRFIKIPQREHMWLNLDHTSFSCNVVKSASSYLTRNFELWQDSNKHSTLGGVSVSDPGSINGFTINSGDKYWQVNNVGNVNLFFGFGVNLLENNQFTLNMTFRLTSKPAYWRNIFWFGVGDKFRIEFGVKDNIDGLFLYGENSLIVDGSQDFRIPPVNGDTGWRNWSTLTLVINGTSVIVYVNGREAKRGTLARTIQNNIEKFYICGFRSGNEALGAPCQFRNLAYWSVALTESELNDYWSIVPTVFTP